MPALAVSCWIKLVLLNPPPTSHRYGAFVLLQFDEVHEVTHHDVVYLEHLTGGRYVEEEDETFTYLRAFDRLSELALDENSSRELITYAHSNW